VDATREVILEQAATGSGVILGHGAAHILQEDPRALRVRLDGPVERRVRRAMTIEHLSEAEARENLERTDRARDAYLRHFYDADPHDMASYHLVIDTTSIAEDVCVDLVVRAAQSHDRASP
jgi:cytidylate kinase